MCESKLHTQKIVCFSKLLSISVNLSAIETCWIHYDFLCYWDVEYLLGANFVCSKRSRLKRTRGRRRKRQNKKRHTQRERERDRIRKHCLISIYIILLTLCKNNDKTKHDFCILLITDVPEDGSEISVCVCVVPLLFSRFRSKTVRSGRCIFSHCNSWRNKHSPKWFTNCKPKRLWSQIVMS